MQPMAELSWSRAAARRMSTGVGLLIAAGVSLLLWTLMVILARFF
jgi:hypothetical protein